MTTRLATCSCGQLNVACTGEPVRISACHCLACQRRTGSAFGAQARFPQDRVGAIDGDWSSFVRVVDNGNTITFRFCPRCGSTVYFTLASEPDLVAIPVGAFADPGFPAPTCSIYEASRHPWVTLATAAGIEHDD